MGWHSLDPLRKLAEFDQKSTWFRRFTLTKLALLDKSVHYTPYARLGILAGYMAHSDLFIARRAARNCTRMLDRCGSSELLAIDRASRRNAQRISKRDNTTSIDRLWLSIEPDQLSSIVKRTGLKSAFGLMTFHPNGYVREEALRVLEATNESWVTSFLMVRMTDRVDSVAAYAERILVDRIPGISVRQQMEIQVLLDQIHHRYGKQFPEVLARLNASHSDVADVNEVKEALITPDINLHKLACEHIMDRPSPVRTMFIEGAGYISESAVNVLANKLGNLTGHEHRIALDNVIRVAYKDTSVPILTDLFSRDPSFWKKRVEPVICCESPQIIEHIVLGYRQLGSSYPIDRYRDIVSRGGYQLLLSGLIGLGYSTRPEDAALIIPYLRIAKHRMRIAAYQSLLRLDPEHIFKRLPSLLAAEPKRIQARKLIQLALGLPDDRLRSLVVQCIDSMPTLDNPNILASRLQPLINKLELPLRQLCYLQLFQAVSHSLVAKKIVNLLHRDCGKKPTASLPENYAARLRHHLKTLKDRLPADIQQLIQVDLDHLEH